MLYSENLLRTFANIEKSIALSQCEYADKILYDENSSIAQKTKALKKQNRAFKIIERTKSMQTEFDDLRKFTKSM